MEQRTEEWYAARCGKVTGSRISDVMMAPSTQGYQKYRAQLIAERLTGEVDETPTTAAMQHGIDTEDRARAMYQLETGLIIQEVGFIDHATIEMAGASPDGLVQSEGGAEFKCPQKEEHIRVCTGGEIKKDYFRQCQWGMECTGREWWDFISFCPMLADEYQLFVRRIYRDEKAILQINERVEAFLESVSEGVLVMEGMAA